MLSRWKRRGSCAQQPLNRLVHLVIGKLRSWGRGARVKFLPKLTMLCVSTALSNLPFGRGGKCWRRKLAAHPQQLGGALNPENPRRQGQPAPGASALTQAYVSAVVLLSSETYHQPFHQVCSAGISQRAAPSSCMIDISTEKMY